MITNILDNLIAEGEVLRGTIRQSPKVRANQINTYYHSTSEQYGEWIANVKRFVRNNHQSDWAEINQVTQSVRLSSHQKIMDILKAIKRIPHEPVKDEKKNLPTNHINITNNQNSNQSNHQENSQNVTLQLFLDAIKDELTGKQFKEVTEILQDYGEQPEPTRTKLIDKMKSFGGDILSNIMANILTNPTIYQGLL